MSFTFNEIAFFQLLLYVIVVLGLALLVKRFWGPKPPKDYED